MVASSPPILKSLESVARTRTQLQDIHKEVMFPADLKVKRSYTVSCVVSGLATSKDLYNTISLNCNGLFIPIR